ncbi:MAG TPA: hypothetical protein VFF33_04670 [Ignavibacteriaceae bacterium]|nr:hypothetical protein [Ignavibacteriaceae bacterium]
MLKKYFIFLFASSLLFLISSQINAQEREPKVDKNTQNCMEKIAADSTLRVQMMNMIMERTHGNKEAMMCMCQTIMINPEMHKTMMNMMKKDGKMQDGMNPNMKHEMMSDSAKDGMNHNMNSEMKGDSTKMKDRMIVI